MGKYIESADRMWELFLAYKEDVNTNHLLKKDWVGKDGTVVQREYTRALTMEGFECFVMDHTRITYPDLTNYFENRDSNYKDYVPVCSRIKREIRRDQIEKGLAGLINPSITQRLNGLVEKRETELKGGLNIPNLPDIGNR